MVSKKCNNKLAFSNIFKDKTANIKFRAAGNILTYIIACFFSIGITCKSFNNIYINQLLVL